MKCQPGRKRGHANHSQVANGEFVPVPGSGNVSDEGTEVNLVW